MFLKVLRETFTIFISEFVHLANVMLLIWLPANFGINWLIHTVPPGSGTWNLVSNIHNLLYPLIVGTVTYMAYCAKTGQSCGAVSGLKKGFSCYVSIVRANIVAGFKILVGFIALVIPGLYFATKYALINPIVVLEPELIDKPRFKSERISVGHRWEIFFTGFLFIAGTIALRAALEAFPLQETGLTLIAINAVIDTIFDLLGCLSTIAMFLYYWELKNVYTDIDVAEVMDEVEEEKKELKL